MANDIFPLGQIWSDAQGWQTVNDFDHGKWLTATEHLHFIGYKPGECTCHPSEAPVPCQHRYAFSECLKAAGQLFSLNDQALYCELCRRAVNELLNSTMRWPNDISGDPGTAAAEREEDEFGPITSRSRWLTPGSSTDYR